MNAQNAPMAGLSRGMDATAISSAAFATQIAQERPTCRKSDHVNWDKKTVQAISRRVSRKLAWQ
jgi:hypothetical protein